VITSSQAAAAATVPSSILTIVLEVMLMMLIGNRAAALTKPVLVRRHIGDVLEIMGLLEGSLQNHRAS
jgi:hypothetical protein